MDAQEIMLANLNKMARLDIGMKKLQKKSMTTKHIQPYMLRSQTIEPIDLKYQNSFTMSVSTNEEKPSVKNNALKQIQNLVKCKSYHNSGIFKRFSQLKLQHLQSYSSNKNSTNIKDGQKSGTNTPHQLKLEGLRQQLQKATWENVEDEDEMRYARCDMLKRVANGLTKYYNKDFGKTKNHISTFNTVVK